MLVFVLTYRRALGPAGAPEDGIDSITGGVLLAVELASAAPDSIVHPGQILYSVQEYYSSLVQNNRIGNDLCITHPEVYVRWYL